MAININAGAFATLHFLPEWRQAGDGAIVRGGEVGIDFVPERLTGCRRNWHGAEVWDIEAFVRFHPRGELVHGSLLERVSTGGVITKLVPKRLAVPIPFDTTQLELWFHNFIEIGGRCDTWDSRFGENYWFDVGGPNPVTLRDPVRYRDGAIANSDFVNVLHHSAAKENVFPRPPNGPPMGTDLRTSLAVQAWVKNVAFAKSVRLDLHVFDRDGMRIEAATYPLRWEGSASGKGDLFRFDGEIYRGSTATPGSVSPRPNSWLVQYRLYFGVDRQTYTDAIPHQIELPDDAVV